VKLLYILGRGRGGSTVLANVLGEIDGFFSAGELRFLWDPVVARNNPCGCGETIVDCALWSKVLDRLRDVDLDRVVRWQHEIVRETNVVRLLKHDQAPWPALEGYAAVTSRLYGTISNITGCDVIVDSSKRPSYAAFVKRLRGCDPYFVHMVRDPRASAYSWRTRRYASAYGAEVRRRNALDSTIRWTMLNLGSEVLLRRDARDHHVRLRYEDFVGSPRTSVEGVCSMVGEPDVALPFVDGTTVNLTANHTIAGNPARFRTGLMELRDVGEWRSAQNVTTRAITTLVALPLLRRYGYGIRAA
jgi:hypothetical protein